MNCLKLVGILSMMMPCLMYAGGQRIYEVDNNLQFPCCHQERQSSNFVAPRYFRDTRAQLKEIARAFECHQIDYEHWQRIHAYHEWELTWGWGQPWGWSSGQPYWYAYDPYLLGPGNQFITIVRPRSLSSC